MVKTIPLRMGVLALWRNCDAGRSLLSVNVLVLLLPPRQRLSRLTLRPRAEKVSEEKCPTGDTGRFIGYSEVIQFDGLSASRRNASSPDSPEPASRRSRGKRYSAARPALATWERCGCHATALLVSQRNQRIDMRCSACWDEASQNRCHRQDQRDASEDEGIVCAHPKKQAGKHAHRGESSDQA
jgi:hypothetical protein